MPDQVVLDLERFKRQLLRGEDQQNRQMARAWLRVERALDAQLTALAADVQAMQWAGRPVNSSRIFQMERYQLLVAQLQVELNRYARYAADVIEGRALEMAQAGLDQAAGALITITGNRVRGAFARLPIEAVTNLVGVVQDGTPLGVWLARNALTAELADSVRNALLLGLARGENPRKMARRMKVALSGGLQSALNTARTVQLNALRDAFREQMQASGVVSGYRRLAAKGPRTCMACLMDDGRFYPITERMPVHNMDRCTQVPVVDGFPRPDYETGRDWFMRQNASVQKRMLGKKRYSGFLAGQFDLDQLMTVRRDAVWGDSIQVTPARDLIVVT